MRRPYGLKTEEKQNHRREAGAICQIGHSLPQLVLFGMLLQLVNVPVREFPEALVRSKSRKINTVALLNNGLPSGKQTDDFSMSWPFTAMASTGDPSRPA